LGPATLIITLLLIVIAIVLYQYRHIFSFIRYRQTLKSLETKEKKPFKPTVEKICPQCGEVMEEGYLVGPEGIYWSKNVPPYGFGLHFRGVRLMNEPLAPNNFLFSDREPILSASRCRRCKIIQVDMKAQDFRIQ
jgi:hypothetical protein